MTVIVGLDVEPDGGRADVRVAEHWLHELVERLGRPDDVIACTHIVREPYPHVAASIASPTPLRGLPPATGPGAAAAAGEHAARIGGRAVHYPGMPLLTGVMTVAELLAVSAIEAVVVLGSPGTAPPPVQEIDTRDHVRPQWTSGRLTLLTQPAAGGRLVPFEFPTEDPCC